MHLQQHDNTHTLVIVADTSGDVEFLRQLGFRAGDCPDVTVTGVNQKVSVRLQQAERCELVLSGSLGPRSARVLVDREDYELLRRTRFLLDQAIEHGADEHFEHRGGHAIWDALMTLAKHTQQTGRVTDLPEPVPLITSEQLHRPGD